MADLSARGSPGMALRKVAAVASRLRDSQAWVLVLLLIVGSLMIRPGVVTGANGEDILRQCTILGLLTVGESIVLIGGGIDLSVAANARISSVFGAMYFGTSIASFVVGVLLTLAVAAAVGTINGVLIGVFRLPAFITTFAVLLVLDGVTLTIAQSAVGGAPASLIGAYTKNLWIVPYPVVVLILAALLVAYCLKSTMWGKSVYAVGGSPVLAGHAGVKVVRTTVTLYVSSGLCSGIASLVLLSRSGVGDPAALQGLELLAITAAAIGAVSLAGGRGSILGALGGVAFLTLVSVLLSQAGVPGRYQNLFQGIIILGALASYRQRRTRAT